MTALPQAWASLPQNPTTDAALRAAAAGVCGFWFDEDNTYMGSFHKPDNWPHKFGYFGSGSYILCRSYAWKPDKDRNQLARVFAAAWNLMRAKAYDFDKVERHSLELRWQTTLTDPRAALASLLDLLAIPVPPKLE